MLVIDNEVAWVGGVGIRSDFSDWRDTGVTITGPAVAEVGRAFALVWRRLDINTFGYKRFKKTLADTAEVGVLINAPRLKQRQIYKVLRKKMRDAHTRIILTTPYFIPDEGFLRSMRQAHARGVYVALIVPKVTDNTLVDYARRFYIRRLLKRGIDVFLYHQHFLHAKYAVIDSWTTVGSCNYDSLSFRFNNELNLAGSSPVFVEHMESQAREDMIVSEKTTISDWTSITLKERILEWVAWSLSAFL